MRTPNIINNPVLKRIARNSSIVLSGNVASSALGFVSFAVLASSIGPALLGYFALAQVYALIFNDLFNVQTWESLIKFGEKSELKEQLPRTIKTNLIIDLVGAFIAFTLAISLAEEIGNMLGWDDTLSDLAFLYAFVIPFTLTTFTIGIPRLFDRFAVVAKIQFAMATVKLAAISGAATIGTDAKTFISVYIVTEILVNVALITYSVTLLRSKNLFRLRNTPIYLPREQRRFLWWTNLRTVVRIPVRQLDVLILNQVMTINAVGIYKVYKEVVSIISRLGEPVNQAIYPEYAKLLGKQDSAESVAITRGVMKILLSLAGICMVVLLLISETLIGKVFGDEYLEFMPAFYALVVLNCINLFLTPINSLFIAAGFAKFSFLIVFANNALYLAVALTAGVAYGIYGIVLAFAVQIAFNQGMKLFCLRRFSTGWGEVIR